MSNQKLSLKDIRALVSRRGLNVAPGFTVQNAPRYVLAEALVEANRRLRDEAYEGYRLNPDSQSTSTFHLLERLY